MKVLGLSQNDHFDFSTHITTVLKTASQRLHVIRCMKYCVDVGELTQVYHALITSVLLYASPAFGQLSSTLLQKLEKFQRRAHRLICGPDCGCSRFPPLRGRFEHAAVELFLRAETNSSHPLHDRIPRRLPATQHFANPVCATNRRLNMFFPWAARLNNFLLSKR